MSNYKILFKITGSIAAYKSAYLISRLVQSGFEVKTVVTESALKFIGKATLEGLTGSMVYSDSFADRQMMSHISLVKWADLTILCPASANTINKFANGIADNLLTSLFLAHDWNKPYLIAPAMNTNMWEHPATQSSLKKLTSWGVFILPTAEGYLACGDIGKGKLLVPDEIFEHIRTALQKKYDDSSNKLKVLITSGATRENIDGIRFISNLSTGKTAAFIADHFLRSNHEVTYLHAAESVLPQNQCERVEFSSFNDLQDQLKNLLNINKYDSVLHLAAVSDYSLDSIEIDGKKYSAPITQKIDSDNEHLQLKLVKNSKIIESIINYSKNKNLSLVAFKFTNSLEEKVRNAAVEKLFYRSNSTFVVLNDLSDRTEENVQTNFRIYNRTGGVITCNIATDLAKELELLLIKNRKES